MSASGQSNQFDVAKATTEIDAFFTKYQQSTGGTTKTLTAPTAAGKVYEAWVLIKVIEGLESEGYQTTLQGSANAQLRSSPGPIRSTYAHFDLARPGEPSLEVWTDVEFLTYSHADRGSPQPSKGDFHELDVLVVNAGVGPGWPAHSDVVIGVECKATPYTKALLRAILGVRRELSLLAPTVSTGFKTWPRDKVPADPASCLLTYCTDAKINQYDSSGMTFGIDFIHDGGP
jgi:hypothetical protein